ncbi:hypothetical protein I2486_02845 [Cellulophaga sp. E16_2]|uniref:hypothetical protein n=1 Tax=Cellulophaga sp. E16_2 TaxID=2789297 RepID=UPI001A92ABE9|nr:hypothetical protein [Cellulophaga sp. E16_2]MBO0590334.1 hypothetical protein [Cellulophaga sp. E16_2]
MMSYFTHKLNRIAVRITLYSFIFETVLFLVVLAVETITVVAIIPVLIAALLNLIILIVSILNTLVNYKDFEENISTLLMVLINIAIGLLYQNLIN